MLYCLLILRITMKNNQYSEIVYTESDLMDLVMQGHDWRAFDGMLVDSVSLEGAREFVENLPALVQETDLGITVEEYDRACQQHWNMPEEYQQLDIAKHLLDLCNTEAELQRVGHELLLYGERDLFNLLRYLKYLVDVMKENGIIWGVGRGSSVASYALYLLGVHKIDSMYYELAVEEFLR